MDFFLGKHAKTTTSFRPSLSKPGKSLPGSLNKSSKTAEPERLAHAALKIRLVKSNASHKPRATLHWKRRCMISSAALQQIGHSPLDPICLLTNIDFRGNIPCRARHAIFLILLGIFSCHRIFHVGLIADDPGRAIWLAVGSKVCFHCKRYADLTINLPCRVWCQATKSSNP